MILYFTFLLFQYVKITRFYYVHIFFFQFLFFVGRFQSLVCYRAIVPNGQPIFSVEYKIFIIVAKLPQVDLCLSYIDQYFFLKYFFVING